MFYKVKLFWLGKVTQSIYIQLAINKLARASIII